MTVAKVWDPVSGSWTTVATGPTIAQHNALAARVTTLEANKDKGALLDFQRVPCTNVGAYRTSSFTGTVAYHVIELTATLAAPNMIMTLSLPVPFFWEITHTNYLIRKDDAAYHYLYSGIRVLPADQDGLTISSGITTQHSAVDQFMHVTIRRTFRCAANTSYQAQAIMGGGNGGTWNYMKDPGTFIEGKAWAQ